MDLELHHRAFLITGGTDGLGLALAQKLVSEGARVAVCGRDSARLQRAQSLLGPGALCHEADVTDAPQLDAFIDATISRFGRLDGAVNNAGRSASGAVADSSDVEWRDDYELKVISALHVARRVLDALEATGGSILNVLAIMALAGEVGPRGIRVNAVLIGLIESGQWVRRASIGEQSLDDYYLEAAANARIPLGRYG